MMIPLYRILEVSLYSLLSFVPLLFLAVWPFRRHLRFKPLVTNLLVVAVCLLQIGMSMLAAFLHVGAVTVYLLRTCTYAAFYFVLLQVEPGKLIFTLLAISNAGNLVSVTSKYLEGILFGDLSLETCRWSLCLCMAIMHLMITVPIFFYIKSRYSNVIRETVIAWRYLWGVPATFFLIWFYHLYLTNQSALQIASDLRSTLFLVVINLGSFLVYHTEVIMVEEKVKARELSQNNHLLTMQKLQYDNLQNRINEARQAKHDVRHHTYLIRDYLRSGKLKELEAYLDNYTASLPDTQSLVHCQHYATNALLAFFAQQAKKSNVDIDIFVQLPETLHLPETTISVVLGNLLENALEASRQFQGEQKKITVRGKADKGFVFFAITNPFDGELRKNKSGKILSTKSVTRGLGLDSVRQLVEANGGVLELSAEDNLFRASILLTEQKVPSQAQ